MKNINTKGALMIIAHNNFRDEEFRESKRVLEENGINVVVASSSPMEAKGMLGMRYKPDITLVDVNVQDFTIIVFIGGSGSTEYWNNDTAHAIAREALSSGKILGAICIAPVILANAGLLNGRRAAVFPSERGRLKSKGAVSTGNDVEQDGSLITATGPEVAEEFGLALVKAFSEYQNQR